MKKFEINKQKYLDLRIYRIDQMIEEMEAELEKLNLEF